MKSLLKNLLILLALAVVLYVGYSFLFSGNDIALNSGLGSTEGEVLTREFLLRLNELEQIDFSRQLFEDPRFRSLTSFSIEPDPAAAGRPNPFAP